MPLNCWNLSQDKILDLYINLETAALEGKHCSGTKERERERKKKKRKKKRKELDLENQMKTWSEQIHCLSFVGKCEDCLCECFRCRFHSLGMRADLRGVGGGV